MAPPINRFTATKRVKLETILRDYRALGILAKRITNAERAEFDRQIAMVPSLPMRSVNEDRQPVGYPQPRGKNHTNATDCIDDAQGHVGNGLASQPQL
jgi:hypothetical protein